MPERIQLRRTKGWRKPEGAVVVARPSRWGNPHVISRVPTLDGRGHYWQIVTDPERELHMIRLTEVEARECAVETFSRTLRYRGLDLEPLRGRDLACWCPLDQPCHADVLIEIANTEREPAEPRDIEAPSHSGRTDAASSPRDANE